MKIEKTSNGNLTIVAETSDMEMLTEMKERVGNDDLRFMDELLEETGWSGNSVLMSISPEDVGGLTEAPIVTDDRTIEDDGKVVVNGNVWWFPNYMVENFADTLIQNGRVTFMLADDVLAT
jgi:hypothetical protein